ncbi:non-symbiotic hemoglobin 2-like [Limulus polyphemus]|uniref:Non-symbiotic hemoglobin 2-like n=1 Tax=Limulus polyphemus TaxID=6850 RepID=A0ABM1BIQ5_LIMPO|nr:non-symbiotic hemoglobin 2-like [Limulus polyphemus]
MGCTVSGASVLRGNTGTQLSENLTPRQVELVRETWTLLSVDMTATGIFIFNRFLTDYPELCDLFPFVSIANDGRYIWDDQGLERHALGVMQALEGAVNNLENTQLLSTILFDLGQKHARYNVEESMLDKLWRSLRGSLKEALQEKMTDEVEHAWFCVFRFVARQMIDGMRHYRNI